MSISVEVMMLKLAVFGIDEVESQSINIRLRNSQVLPGTSLEPNAPSNQAIDALAFFGNDLPDFDRVTKAIQSGKHVLIATNRVIPRSQIEQLQSTAQKSSATFVIANPDHARPSRNLIKQQITSGKLGDVGLIRIIRCEPHPYDPTLNPSTLPDGLIRDVELATWLMARPLETVFALRMNSRKAEAHRKDHIESGPSWQIHLGFDGDGMALLTYSHCGHAEGAGGDDYQTLSVIASTGAAYADDHANQQLLFHQGGTRAIRQNECSIKAIVVQEFVDVVSRKENRSASLEEWTHVWNTTSIIEQSIRSGQVVRVGGSSRNSPQPTTEKRPEKTSSISNLPVTTHKTVNDDLSGHRTGNERSQSFVATEKKTFRCAVLSAVKHDYVARGVAIHPRFEIVVVADDPQIETWAHERNQQFADILRVPYVRNIEQALRDYDIDVVIVSPEAERHCDLSIRAARMGKHVIQDKPMTTVRSEAERLVSTIEETGVRFLMWNRNYLPTIETTFNQIQSGLIGRPLAIHADFYFAKDAGPPKGSRLAGYPPINWRVHQIACHIDGSDGGIGHAPMGELAIEGIYPLGYIRRLMGVNVERVFARGASHFHQVHVDNNIEDLASVTLEMERGIVATLAIGRIGLASHPSGGEIKLFIQGTEGSLSIQESHPDVGIYYKNQPVREAKQRRVASENDFLLAQNFAEAIDHNRTTILDAQASLEVFATFEAAMKSCRTGEVEAVNRSR
ncbi:MAG: hypothetical protein FJ267_00960 [Planctomycetes bacterium]|nr:hypothetical protein [Planctomycetota bacterium]